MPPRPRGTCDWGGCDDPVQPGSKWCPRHTIEAARNSTTAHDTPDLFSQQLDATARAAANHFKTRAALPEAFAEPIAGKALTSKRAAAGAREGYKARKTLIHEHIIQRGSHGATRPEIAEALGIGVNSVNSACNTLYRQGYIGSNEGHERADPTTGVMCSVLVDEAHVARWRGRPRLNRATECDLVHPETGESLTETQLAKLSGGEAR